MFILRHFSHHIYDETLRTEVNVLSFLAHLSFAPRFISVILSPHRIRKIAHRGLFLFIFSASQLRTEVHIWKFCHHLEFEALRTEVNFCSFIAHLSFATTFIFGHFWSCYHHIKVETLRTEVHFVHLQQTSQFRTEVHFSSFEGRHIVHRGSFLIFRRL